MTDAPLPLPVNAVLAAADLAPGPVELMLAADGVALDCAADAARAWPTLWPARDGSGGSAEAARKAFSRRSAGQNGIDDSLYGNVPHFGLRRASYRLTGQGRETASLIFDPALVLDLRRWLEERVGPLAMLEIAGTGEAPRAPPRRRTRRAAPVASPAMPEPVPPSDPPPEPSPVASGSPNPPIVWKRPEDMPGRGIEQLRQAVTSAALEHWPREVVAAMPLVLVAELTRLTQRRPLPANATVASHDEVVDEPDRPGVAALVMIPPVPDPAQLRRAAEASTGIRGGGPVLAAMRWEAREGVVRRCLARCPGAALVALVPAVDPLRLDAPPSLTPTHTILRRSPCPH